MNPWRRSAATALKSNGKKALLRIGAGAGRPRGLKGSAAGNDALGGTPHAKRTQRNRKGQLRRAGGIGRDCRDHRGGDLDRFVLAPMELDVNDEQHERDSAGAKRQWPAKQLDVNYQYAAALNERPRFRDLSLNCALRGYRRISPA
jgi:hypothetical protein